MRDSARLCALCTYEVSTEKADTGGSPGLAGQPWDAVSEFPAQGETLKKVGEREWREDEDLSECVLLF